MQEAKLGWRKAVMDLNASDKQKTKARAHYCELIGECEFINLKLYLKFNLTILNLGALV